jgi:hypothetical protein
MRFDKIKSQRATLTVLEDFPFPIKRAYFMQGMDTTEVRGNHSHKKNRQIVICVRGSFRFNKKVLFQNDYVILEPEEWHTMFAFTPDCIILVLASEEYDENDYIREKSSKP